MGADFVFVDAVARPELAALVRHDPSGALDRTGANQALAGRVWGDPVLDISTDLSVSALSPGTAEAVAKVVENAVGHGKAVDLVALATEVVVAGLVAHAGAPCDAAAVAAWVRDLEASYGVFDAMVPIATPAVRRRVAARDALVDALDVPLFSLMVASARNASMAVVASMLQLAQDPDAQAQHRADLSSCALELAGLQVATGLHAVLAAAVQNHGHGGVWRQACRATTIDGMPIPEGALVGLTDGRTVGVGEASVRGLDESFGLGLPELRLPEVLALLGLSVMLRAGSWSVRTAPRRWTPAFLPGMGWPVGPVRVAVDGG